MSRTKSEHSNHSICEGKCLQHLSPLFLQHSCPPCLCSRCGAWHSNQPRDVHVISYETLSIETGAVEDPKPWIQWHMRTQDPGSGHLMAIDARIFWCQLHSSSNPNQTQGCKINRCRKHDNHLDDARYPSAICSSSVSAPQLLPLSFQELSSNQVHSWDLHQGISPHVPSTVLACCVVHRQVRIDDTKGPQVVWH